MAPSEPRRAASSESAGIQQTVRAEGGYAYGVVGADLHVFQDAGPVYQLADHHPRPQDDGTAEWLLSSPAACSPPATRSFDFTGRDQEQRDLKAWRDTADRRIAARWLHAPGGAGKTRLAAEFAASSAAEGWKVVTVVHGRGVIIPPPQSVDLRLADATGVLLVVDYADRWPLSHLTWLFSNALLHHQLPTRLLLLARSAQPWPPVRSALDDLRIATDQSMLQPVPNTGGLLDRERMYTVARDCFAARYGLTDPAVIGPPGPLQHPYFGLVLTLHMAALAAVRRLRPHRQPPHRYRRPVGLPARPRTQTLDAAVREPHRRSGLPNAAAA